MIYKIQTLIALVLLTLFVLSPANAEEQEFDPTMSDGQVRLNFNIQKSETICMELGSEGASEDSVNFNVSTPTYAEVEGDKTLQLYVGASVANEKTIELIADSSIPFTDGRTIIPTSKIRIYSAGGGAFSGLDAWLDGSSDQLLWTGTGPGDRTDMIGLSYMDNIADLPAGTYETTIKFMVRAKI